MIRQNYLNLLRKLWEQRDIVIVEGEHTRSGVGNNLYDNARSVQRIIGLSKNAFDKYDEMLNAIIKHVRTDKLIILCYGMTATVLAYDLTKFGFQAIDLGHVDIEYEWFLRGSTNRDVIKGKYTNEAKGGDLVDACHDETYLSSIICNIN